MLAQCTTEHFSQAHNVQTSTFVDTVSRHTVTFVSVNIPWLSRVSFGLQLARQHASHNAQQALLLVQDTNLHTHGLHDYPGGLSDQLANAPKTQSDTTHMTSSGLMMLNVKGIRTMHTSMQIVESFCLELHSLHAGSCCNVRAHTHVSNKCSN